MQASVSEVPSVILPMLRSRLAPRDDRRTAIEAHSHNGLQEPVGPFRTLGFPLAEREGYLGDLPCSTF
jgi:hypothetical protein